MKILGRAAVSEYMGDFIVYRNLIPADQRLPDYATLCVEAGKAPGSLPRKNEDDYAQTVALLLQRARALDVSNVKLRRLIYIGDTRLSDVTAFSNLCRVGGWSGVCFIGSENKKPPAFEITQTPNGQPLFLSNRWSALTDAGETGFGSFCAGQGCMVDEATAVLIDLDKTAIGARGRNAGVIDAARVQAVQNTVAGLLGEAFDLPFFLTSYNRLNDPEFHSFTADNQDYLAYICLILGGGLYELNDLIETVHSGKLQSFEQFIDGVDAQKSGLPGALSAIHEEIYANVKKGDPTPFKPFRRNEYLVTIGRMGHLADDAPVETVLEQEIALTQEVRELAFRLKHQGALVFGLSDKPDEASTPTAELAAQGYAPIHYKVTHAVGG